MRKNSPRKWLHACLDFLPLVVIPVFMVYSHRHTIDNYTVVRSEPLEVNAFQGVLNGKPYGVVRDDDVPNWDIGNLGSFYSIDGVLYTLTPVNGDNDLIIDCNISFNQNDVIYFKWFYDIGDIGYFDSFGISISDHDETLTVIVSEDNFINNFRTVVSNDVIFDNIDIYYYTTGETSFSLGNIQLFNLTSIFGSGNEPTNEVFESFLTQDYYNFGNNTLSVGTYNVTYDDTDIGSQFTYTLYNTTEKYFNFNQVFNLNGFWNWINTNMFGGNAPLMAKSIWNIIVYEFVIDLLFVFYSFFMFLIDFTDSLLEKPFNKGR